MTTDDLTAGLDRLSEAGELTAKTLGELLLRAFASGRVIIVAPEAGNAPFPTFTPAPVITVDPARAEGRPDDLLDIAAVGAALDLRGKPASIRRAVARIAKKHKLRKVELGHRTVRYRPADVAKLKAKLAGEPQVAAR